MKYPEQVNVETENRPAWPRAGGTGNDCLVIMGSFGGDENMLELNRSGGCTTL